jgi:gamma-glutamyl:cysteine ligase YbdK (ATP-grasp superfamily)
MGLPITRDHFDADDVARFERRLRANLAALAELLERPGFGEGPTTIGAELELDLVDATGRPAPVNRQVLADVKDRRVTLEVDKFNLEINADATTLAGRPFSALGAGVDAALAEIARAAKGHGACPLTIGILPTLTPADLNRGALTDGHRYRAMSAAIRKLRGAPVPVRIDGDDPLELATDDVTFEGANTSFQVHLRVPPSRFAACYNAAQIATAPALAVAVNSPLFLGHRLWDETRVALFRQSTEDRAGVSDDDWRPARVTFGHGWARAGAHELFAESVALHAPLLPVVGPEDPLAVTAAGGVPTLAELKLHHGTVWRWNRAVYDDGDGGHLRIEMRALPSGPTIADVTANAAFLVGLVLAFAPDAERWVTGLTFGNARRNFYTAARQGLAAELLWPPGPGERVEPVTAAAVVERLLPVSAAALRTAGVDPDEIERQLAVIARRVQRGRTGARWQRATFESVRRTGASVDAASAAVVQRYLQQAATGRPIDAWDVEDGTRTRPT